VITEEEKREIIDRAKEELLLAIPEVVGNLIMNQVNLGRLNRDFYTRFPDFAQNKDVVASVVEKLEGEYPGLEYKELLDKAVPYIREQISTTKKLNLTSIVKPNRNLSVLNLHKSNHGEL
jgi:hypothetical protein